MSLIRKSSRYWREREARAVHEYMKRENRAQQDMNAVYNRMLEAAQEAVNGFLTRYASKNGITMADAKKRVATADMEALARKAKRYCEAAARARGKDVKNPEWFSKEANEEMAIYNLTMKVNRLELLRAQIGLELVDGFDELSVYFENQLTDVSMTEFETMAGILGYTIRGNLPNRVSEIVHGSVQSATFSERLWKHQNLLKYELSKVLENGLIQGISPSRYRSRFVELFNVSKKDADRLFRTEMQRVRTASNLSIYKSSGYNAYEFISGDGSNGECEICAALDGKVYPIDKMRYGENAPPLHPRCRCSTAPYYTGGKI
jgi:SPP1 gp7 family putative phage head morphogenesis protein